RAGGGVAVAVAGDVRQAAVPGLVEAEEVRLGARVDAAPRGVPGDERGDAVARGGGRGDARRAALAARGVGAEGGDAGAAVVVAGSVTGDDVLAENLAAAREHTATAPLVGVAELVDEHVVADVAPAEGLRVVGVDGTHLGLRLRN